MKIYDASGIARDTTHILLVEKLEKLKVTSGSNPWPVIEEIFKVWQAKKPKEWKSHLIYLDGVKASRRGKFAASEADAVHGGILRYTIDIPEFVMKAIRFLYTPEELPMDREFFLRFAKKFPDYQVAEKI